MAKRIKALWVAAGVLAVLPAFAAEYKNEVGIGGNSFVDGPAVYYERHFNGYISGTVGAAFDRIGHTFIATDGDVTELDGWNYDFSLGVKLYTSGAARGFNIAAALHYTFEDLEEKNTGEPANFTRLIPAITLGWRWILFDRMTLSPGGGVGYVAAGRKSGPGTEHMEYRTAEPYLEFTLGILF